MLPATALPGVHTLIDVIYQRLADAFFENPKGLPYQYCLIGLVKKSR
jgi:hypothetical protein